MALRRLSGWLEFDTTSLDKATDRTMRNSRDMRAVWKVVRKPFRQRQAVHVEKQESSTGSKWPGLAPSTRDKRLRKGGRHRNYTKKGKIRKPAQRRLNKVLSKRFASALQSKSTPSELRLTSRIRSRKGKPYSMVHQKGGYAGMGGRIPAREFLYVDAVIMVHVLRLIGNYMAKSFEIDRALARVQAGLDFRG